jgi:hypothetical protein
MKPLRVLLAVTVVILAGVFSSAEIRAQYTPYYRPAPNTYVPPAPISPYLNMLRGNNAAVNYYLGVRPEFQLRALQQQVLIGEERRQTPVEETTEVFPKLAGTGHPAVFLNYGGYYNLGAPAVQQTPINRRTGH